MPETASPRDSILSRLNKTDFSAADCELALRGDGLPDNLGNRVVHLCLVGGIRRHAAFARSAEISELCRIDGQSMFARARNARLIMSGEVPDRDLMPDEATYPYCIWYPDVASQGTYRELAATFPAMRYQVGRACAVAGYIELYRELDLLPDPCIAEEARESGRSNEGSRQIFEHIMGAPVRYSIMNDYDMTIQLDAPRPGAFLNADTAVLATLQGRRKFSERFVPWRYFNITEDWGIGSEKMDLKPATLTDDEVALLESPLPFDLPTMHKDLLILVAAYEGNLDRYARLRRPRCAVEWELHCLVPGVYRSTAMALWLGRNPDVMDAVAAIWDADEVEILRRAIHARHVMNNDTSRLLDAVPPVPDDELPYWIWYPTVPSAYTLCKLARERPAMRQQCIRASIAGSLRQAYTEIMDMPGADGEQSPLAADWLLVREAKHSLDRDFFVADLARRREELGLKIRRPGNATWKMSIPSQVGDISSTTLYDFLRDDGSCIVHVGQDWGMWESLGAELGRVRLHLSSPPEMRAKARAAKDRDYLLLEDM